MSHGRSKIFSAGAALHDCRGGSGDRGGTRYSVPRNENHDPRVCTTVRMYRSAQRKLISFTAPPCVSPAPNFTVRTGPQKRRSRPRTGPLNTETFPVDTPPFSRAFAAAVINRVQPPHVSAVPARIFGSFGNSRILARGNLSRESEKRRIGSDDVHRSARDTYTSPELLLLYTRSVNCQCSPKLSPKDSSR